MNTLAAKFPPAERRLLLSTPRIGPLVVVRLESMGIACLDELRRLGVDSVVQVICEGAGNSAWAHRRSALLQALHVADCTPGAMPGTCPRPAAPRRRVAASPGV